MNTTRVYYGKETLRRILEERKPGPLHRWPWLLAVGVAGGLFVTGLATALSAFWK